MNEMEHFRYSEKVIEPRQLSTKSSMFEFFGIRWQVSGVSINIDRLLIVPFAASVLSFTRAVEPMAE